MKTRSLGDFSNPAPKSLLTLRLKVKSTLLGMLLKLPLLVDLLSLNQIGEVIGTILL